MNTKRLTTPKHGKRNLLELHRSVFIQTGSVGQRKSKPVRFETGLYYYWT
ncbi:hypothetical protein HanPSC8_Chr09g0367971 [Helianthus annuus]|nr:hypothetical protein HanPSC8_Chr09g0367971 [Helianthus annuus]